MKYYTVEDANVRVEKLVPGGQALATLPDGKKAFFWGTLPGETVTSYQVTKSKSSYLEATALTIASPSPHRITPRDDCYLSTSPWQIMTYDYELQQKATLVKECFHQTGIEECFLKNMSEPPAVNLQPSRTEYSTVRDAGPTDVVNLTTAGGDRSEENTLQLLTDNRPYHYRNKMEYSLYWDNETGRISLAFHQRGSHRKVPITQSSLERPEIFAKAQEIVANLNARHAEARRYQSLMLRCDQQGTVSGGLFENGQPHPNFPPLTDRLLDHEYTYSPNGFFQINLPVYEMALREIAQHIHTDKVLDLYAGVGTIGLSVARDRELTLVEVNKAAYEELRKNVTRATQNNILAQLSASEDALDFITGAETVILDPPRAGCDPKLLARLTEQLPPTIIYLSCNPITQARDVKTLTEQGHYRIASTTTYNFFPRTPHIENLVILTKS